MSWWVSLEKDGKLCKVPLFEEGGTRPIGGQEEADLNVTYNYGKHFDFNSLNNKRGSDVIPILEKRVLELKKQALGEARSDDYWNPTKGNVAYNLDLLLSWAKLHPDGVFRVR